MNKTIALLAFLFLPLFLFSQIDAPAPTSAADRLKNAEIRNQLLSTSLVKNVPFESIGPSVFSGRVSDVDVWGEDPTHFYVAYSSGGLWKTENNGQSFTPIFDNEAVMTMGDIAVDWEQNVIWVGTGEVNSSRSSYSGDGVYKSQDNGATWEHMGLPESHHIGRIILHPNDPNTLWVAALGHLYSPNEERGVYKTTDGGKSWSRTLYVNENTGAVDLVIDPLDENTLYAAMWHRERRSWNFVESGEGSGIFKSTDGGETWARMSTESSGFPTGEGAGRIGLDVAVKDGKTYLVAVIDNQDRRPKDEEEEEEGLTKEEFKGMEREAFLELNDDDIEDFLRSNRFPKKYTAASVKEMVRKNEIKPIALAEYLENANALLFDTPVIGAEVYESVDGAATWQRTHEDFLEGIYYSYGYYFGQIRLTPQDPDRMYIFGVPVIVSDDGGKNWKSVNEDNVHSDHHALWINPARNGHLILGNDGGINISYDFGENWVKCNTPALGQYYHIAVDFEKNYNVYGGLQDNGSWYGPHSYKANNRWHGSGQYPYKAFGGGDGMQSAVDTRDNNIVYGGSQFGFYFRYDKSSGQRSRITPQHELGERPYRWNWQTPIHLSIHNQDILYMGANKLFRSMNQGDDWQAISEDLTNGGITGDVPFGTLTTIHESSLKFGLLYVGTDDGKVHVTKDGGHSWTDISAGLPQDRWVSRVQASGAEEGRVYVALNGYRWDNFEALVYASEDFGATWKKIGDDLPLEPVNVIKEDPVNSEIIYVGTDHGLYVSFDRGGAFYPFSGGLPNVPVHDVVIHPTENDILVGTHGRSLYLADASAVQELTAENLEKGLFVYEIEKIKYRKNWGEKYSMYDDEIAAPEIPITVYAKEKGELKIEIKSGNTIIKSWTITVDSGLNFTEYDGAIDADKKSAFEKELNKDLKKDEEKTELNPGENGVIYLIPGKYAVEFSIGDFSAKKTLVIEDKK